MGKDHNNKNTCLRRPRMFLESFKVSVTSIQRFGAEGSAISLGIWLWVMRFGAG